MLVRVEICKNLLWPVVPIALWTCVQLCGDQAAMWSIRTVICGAEVWTGWSVGDALGATRRLHLQPAPISLLPLTRTARLVHRATRLTRTACVAPSTLAATAWLRRLHPLVSCWQHGPQHFQSGSSDPFLSESVTTFLHANHRSRQMALTAHDRPGRGCSVTFSQMRHSPVSHL